MKGISIMLLLSFLNLGVFGQDYQKDVIATSGGELEITCVAHGTLMMEFNELVIHIDPVTMLGTDYSRMPKADLILITHAHGDHMDPKAIEQIRKENTVIILTAECAKTLGFGNVMANGDHMTVYGIGIDAVSAYNLTSAFHPKGVGNGYVLQFGDKKVYIAGDTENIPEISNLKDVHVAFLPMNLPYTMSPEMVTEVARRIRPDILYPYHYGNTNTGELIDLLKDEKDIELRIRRF